MLILKEQKRPVEGSLPHQLLILSSWNNGCNTVCISNADRSLHPSPMGPTCFIRQSKVSSFASPTKKSELQQLFLNESLHRIMEATSQHSSVEIRGYKKVKNDNSGVAFLEGTRYLQSWTKPYLTMCEDLCTSQEQLAYNGLDFETASFGYEYPQFPTVRELSGEWSSLNILKSSKLSRNDVYMCYLWKSLLVLSPCKGRGFVISDK